MVAYAAGREAKKLEEVARRITLGDVESNRPQVNRTDVAAQLRKMGAPAALVARYQREATQDDGNDGAVDEDEDDEQLEDGTVIERNERRTKVPAIEVLECNWQAVEVFRRCQLTWVSGMRAVCVGISAKEIRSAAWLMQIEQTEWMQLTDDVQLMGRVAAAALNKQKSTS